jgi:D-glycero-beta-D-manno-heptose 1-phosphate adenylyltransferase
MGQFLTLPKLIEKISNLRKNKKVVFTNGCFDLLHIGHIRYLQAARSMGDFLVVALNTDSSVKKIKGPSRPIQTENDRAEILAALSFVDFTFLFDDPTPEAVIKKIRPDILVKGGDWKVEQIVGSDFVKSNGGEVYSLPYVDGKSTTALINKSQEK